MPKKDDVSEAMLDGLQRLSRTGWFTIYFTGVGVSTVQALERRGLVKVKETGLGGYGWNHVRITPAGKRALWRASQD